MRTHIPESVQAQVLSLSRRRCAICFGLHRDTAIKAGQIAHLDRNSSNAAPDNLVFLCLEHHDQYDSTTSQSKGLTPDEVWHYRKELHEAIGENWKRPAAFPSEPGLGDPVSGSYFREGKFEQSELQIQLLPGNRVRVQGFTVWGTQLAHGPNIGELAFEAPLSNSTVKYADLSGGRTYELELKFEQGMLTSSESTTPGYFGLNVTFEGTYTKLLSSSSSQSSDAA